MSQNITSSVDKIQSDVSSNIDTLRKLKTYLDLALTSNDDANLSKVEHVLKSLEDLLYSNINSDWHHIREEFFDLLDLCLQTILKIFDIDRAVFNRMCFKWLCLIRACVNNYRGHMLVGLGKTMLEFVLDSKQNLSPRKAMLETFILCLAACDFDFEEELCPILQCYLVPLVKLLVNCGEYKMQCFVLEAILHLEADNTSLNRVFQRWPDVKQAFLSCTFQDFNKECRYLLNILNHALGPKQLVFSLPCVRLYVGTEELSKPKGSSNMWVDINCGSRTVSVQYVNPHLEKTRSSVLIIDHHKVANAALEKSGSDDYVILRVSLNKAHNGLSSTQIKILFKKSVLPLDLENILKRLFGDTFQVINNKRVLKPILTSSKASISKEMEYVNGSKCSYKASCSTPIISPYFEGVSNNTSLNSSLQSSSVVNSKQCSSLGSFSMDKELSTSHFCENTNITIDLPKVKASISAPVYSCKKTNLFQFFHENQNNRDQTIDQNLREVKQPRLTKTNRLDIIDDIILEPNTPLNTSNLKMNISNPSVSPTIGYESKPPIQQKVSNIPIKTSKKPKKIEEIENNSNLLLPVCKQSENTYINKLETSITQRGSDNNASMSIQENVDRSVPKDICLNPKTSSRVKKSGVLCPQNGGVTTLKSQTSAKGNVTEYVLSDDIENPKTGSRVKKSDELCPQNGSVTTLKSQTSVKGNVNEDVLSDNIENPKTGSRVKKSDKLCPQNGGVTTLKSQTSAKGNVTEYVLSDDIENPKTGSRVKKSDKLCPQNGGVTTLKSQTSVKGNVNEYVLSDNIENPKTGSRVKKSDKLCPQNGGVTTLKSQTSAKGNVNEYVLSDDIENPKTGSRVKKSDKLCPHNGSVMTLKSQTSAKGNVNEYVLLDNIENPKTGSRVKKSDELCPQNGSVTTLKSQTSVKGNVNEYVLSDNIENPKTGSRVKKSDKLSPQNGGVTTLKSQTTAKENVNKYVLSDNNENPKTNSRGKKSYILCPQNDNVTTLKSQISAKVNEQKNVLLYDIETDKTSSVMKKSNILCSQNVSLMTIHSQTLAKGNENMNVLSDEIETDKTSSIMKKSNIRCPRNGTVITIQSQTLAKGNENNVSSDDMDTPKSSKQPIKSSKATTKNIPNLPRLSKLAIIRENKLSSKIKTNKENQTNLETKSFPKKNVRIKENLKLSMKLRSARKSHSIPNMELEPINIFVNSPLKENFPKSYSCSLSSDDYIDATPGIDITPKFKNKNKGKENFIADSKNNLKHLDKKHNLLNPKQLQKYEKNNVLKTTSDALLSNENQDPILKHKSLSSHNVINNNNNIIKSVPNKIMVPSSKFEEESTKKLVITSLPHQTGSKLVINSEISNPLPSNNKKNTEEEPNSRNCTDFKEQINLNQIQNKDFTSIISAASTGLEVCPVSHQSNHFNIQRNITNLKNSFELKQNGKSKPIDSYTTASVNECLKNTTCSESSAIVLNKSPECANYIFSNNKSEEENQKCPHRITQKIKTSKQYDKFNASLQVKNNLISDHLEPNSKPSNFIEKNVQVHDKNNSSKLEFTKLKKSATKRKLKDANSKENIQNIFHSVDRNVCKIVSKNQGIINNMSITSPIKIVSKNYVDQVMSNNVTNISETPCIDNNTNVPRKKRKLFSKTPNNELIMTSNNFSSKQQGIHFDYDLEKTSRDLTMLKNNIPTFAKLSHKFKKKKTRSKNKKELNNIYSKDIGDTSTSKIKMVYSSNKIRKNKTQNKRYKTHRKNNEVFWPSPNKFEKAPYEIELTKAEQNTCRPPPNANRWKEKFITDVKKKSKIKLRRDRHSAYTSIFSEVESDDSLWQKNISQDSFSNNAFTFTSKNKKKPRRKINNSKKNSKFECAPCESSSENENLPPLIVEIVKPNRRAFFTRSRTEERHLTNDASVKPLDNITNNLNTLLELPNNVADASLFKKTNNDMSSLLNRSSAHDGTHNFHSDSENPLQKNISQKRVHPVLNEANLCKESDTVKPNMFLTSPIRIDHEGNFKINQLKCNNINFKKSHIHNNNPHLCSQETVIVKENIPNKHNCSDLSGNEKSSNEYEVGKSLHDNVLEISKASKISSNKIKKGSKEVCINSFTKHLITNPIENMQFQEMNLNLIEARDDHNEAGKIISPNSNTNNITPILTKNNGEKTLKYIGSKHQFTKMTNNDTKEKTCQEELHAQGVQKLNVESDLLNETLGKDANNYFQKMNDKMSLDFIGSKLDKNSCQRKTNGVFPSETNFYISKHTVASNFAAKSSDGPNFSQPILLQVENDQEKHIENKVQKKSDKLFSSMDNEAIDVDAFLLEMGCTQNSTHCGIEKLCSSQTNKSHSSRCTENSFVSLNSSSMSNNSVNTSPIEVLPLCNNNNSSSNIHQPETISANFDLDDNSLKSFDDLLLTPKVDNALKKHNKSINKTKETFLNKETTVIENTSKFKCSSQLSTDSKKKHESKYSKIIRKEIIHTAAYDPIVKLSSEQNTMIRTLRQNAETKSHRFHNHKEGHPTSEEPNTYNGILSLSCLQSTQEMLENHVQKRSRYLSEFQAKVMRKLQSCFSDTYERNQKQRFAVVNRYLTEIENEMQVMDAHQTQLKTFEQQLSRLREYITKMISSQSLSSKNVSHSLSQMHELHRKVRDELDKLESSHKNDLDTDMKSARDRSVDLMRQFWAHERRQAFLKMNSAIQAMLLC